jgi:phospholipid-binding protein, PBP family
MQLTSDAFENGGALPVDYTCRGRGVNPPLTISDVPEGTKSLALIMHDPDAVGGRDFLHWTVWNIPPDTTRIEEGSLPVDAIQGTNDYPNQTYGPACPPAGTGLHRYIFDLYALDTVLDLPAGASRQELEAAIRGHTLATAQLIGTVQA